MCDQPSVDRILREAFPDVDSDDPGSYFTLVGDVFLALSFSYLFWPKFVTMYDAVFVVLGEGHERLLRERLTVPLEQGGSSQRPLSWARMVNTFNWFEVSQLFSRWREPRALVPAAYDELDKILCRVWRAKLRGDFPDRIFKVDLVEADQDLELRIEVTQVSPALTEPVGWDPYRRFVQEQELFLMA